MARREPSDPELEELLAKRLPPLPLPKMRRRPADKMFRRHADKASPSARRTPAE